MTNIFSPQQVLFSSSWRGSLDVWQPLPVACFMAFICRHIMTGSSGFQLDRWALAFFDFAPVMFFDCLPTQILNVTVFFSLKELERELTFQEGSGLYYYYYKHMLTAPSFEQGSVDGLLWLTDLKLTLWNSHSHVVNCFDVMGFSGLLDLILDNKTISGQTINVVQHLSLYPELITSFIYKVTNSQVSLSLMSDEPLKYQFCALQQRREDLATALSSLFRLSWFLFPF